MTESNTYHCNLVRSFRRTISLEVERNGILTIRAPHGLSKRRIDKFLNEKNKWIRKKTEEAKNQHNKAEELSKKLNPSLIKKYKKHARNVLNQRTKHFSDEYNLSFNKVRLSSAKRRWGSCSGKNNLNFNWKIIFAPESVIDYLVAHEIAHTKHKNHQKRFWALVEKMHPEYKKSRKWLRENSYLLQINSLKT